MGYLFELDSGNNILRCSWEGRISDDHLLEGVSAALKLVASHPSRKVMDDYSGVTEFDVSSRTIERIASMQDAPLGRVDSMVVVIAPKDLLYGMARILSMVDVLKHPNVHVVRTIEQAYALLGLTSAQFSPITVP